MFRIIWRSGAYQDVESVPEWSELPTDTGDTPWAIIDLEICEGGDAYQALLEALNAMSLAEFPFYSP